MIDRGIITAKIKNNLEHKSYYVHHSDEYLKVYDSIGSEPDFLKILEILKILNY